MLDRLVDEKSDVNENCLFMSISASNTTANQPVMVYLAGINVIQNNVKSFETDPHYILEKDVVLVSVQYRAGPFGFLSTQTNDIPGNAGILDVIEALRFIKKYISIFGGDPNKVTLFGQYHSAAIINILTMTPLIETEDLFHQVIYQTGLAVFEDFITDDPVALAKQIAKHLHCESKTVTDVNNCLQKANPVALLKAYQQIAKTGLTSFITVGGPSNVLPDKPSTLYDTKKVRAYPTIAGTVKHPGVCLIQQYFGKKVNGSDDTREGLKSIKNIFLQNYDTDDHNKKYIDEKFPNKIFTNNILVEMYPAMIDAAGLAIKYAIAFAVNYNAKQGAPSYLYTFNYEGAHSRLDCSKGNLKEISIADENIYLFPFKYEKGLQRKDKKIAKFMVELWTSFAISGKPSASGLHEWPQAQKGILGPYLGIDFIYKINYNFIEEFFVALKDQSKNLNIFNQF